MLKENFIKFKTEMARRGLRILDKIGEGGMGEVYEALDEALERRCAVKIMRADAGGAAWNERFRREAKFAAKIIHPGVAQVYQAGELEGLLYYVMEFVDGATLSLFIKKARFIESRKDETADLIAAGYLKQPDLNAPYFLRDLIAPPSGDPAHLKYVDELIAAIADILAAVHELDSVHRDIKPSNIMISSGGRIKLVDFGLVKRSVDSDLTQANQFVGTFDYMAPEQFGGKNAKTSPASDIYSLGVVYYELAALVKPFEGDDIASLIGAITSRTAPDPREFNAAISPAQAEIIFKCLDKNPARRFANARELAAAVKGLKHSPPEGIMAGIKNFFTGLFFNDGNMELQGRQPSGYEPQVHSSLSSAGASRQTFSPRPDAPLNSTAPVADVMPPADKNMPAQASERAKISAALFEEAKEEYFKDFVTDAVRDKLNQSFDINACNADSLLLFYLFLNHGIITRVEFDIKLKLTRAGADSLDARSKLILDAITAIYSTDDVKLASAAGFRYINLYPDDLLMMVFVSLIEILQGNFSQALHCCEKVIARRADFLLMHLIKADIYATTGSADKSVEIGKELIARYPQNVNHKFLLIQNLIVYGRLDEAERLIAQMTGDGDESYQRASYYMCRKMIKESVIETRKLIALETNPLFKSYHYYRLYRIFELAGEREKAAENLLMANKLSPGHNFKNFETIGDEIKKITLNKTAFENIDYESLTAAFQYSKNICLKTLDPLTHVKLSLLSETAYYHFEPRGGGEIMNCEKVIIYSDYHFKPSPVTKNMVSLESIPVSPFISYKGDIYEAALKKFISPNGNYYALVNFSPPQQNGEFMFFMAQFEPAEFKRDEKKGIFLLKTGEKANSNGSFTGVVISFANNFKAVSVSCPPDEISEINGRIFYYYTKFLFCAQKFSVELELSEK